MSVPVVRPDRIPLRRPGVVFQLNAEMLMGSCQRVLVRTRTVALPFDDLDFAVRAGEGATVSVSRDETFDAKRPTVMLLAGDVPGDYRLVATQRCTRTVVGESRFTVTGDLADPRTSTARSLGTSQPWTHSRPA